MIPEDKSKISWDGKTKKQKEKSWIKVKNMSFRDGGNSEAQLDYFFIALSKDHAEKILKDGFECHPITVGDKGKF